MSKGLSMHTRWFSRHGVLSLIFGLTLASHGQNDVAFTHENLAWQSSSKDSGKTDRVEVHATRLGDASNLDHGMPNRSISALERKPWDDLAHLPKLAGASFHIPNSSKLS